MLHKKIRDCLLIFCVLITIPCCRGHGHLVKKKVTIAHPSIHKIVIKNQIDIAIQPPPLTIWVHGTRLWRQLIFTTFFEGKPNLKPAFLLDQSKQLREIADILSKNNPEKYPLDTFFLFGWSGKLDAYERENAAQHLIIQLRKLIAEYKKAWNTYPKIQMIAHSHGGNVIMSMLKMDPTIADDIHIDELVLLACPVQEKTRHFINNSMFNKIFVFYSSIDMVQVLAPQICGKESHYKLLPFSSRRFPTGQNIKQIKIKMNNRALMHTEFIAPRFLDLFSDIIDIVNSWKLLDTFPDETLSTQYLLSIYSYNRLLTKN